MEKRPRFNQRKDNLLKWKNSMRILLAGLAGIGVDVYAAPIGIIGGQDNASNAYASLVLQNGTLIPVAGLPANSFINSVAMNPLDFSIIGGQASGTNGYVATVSSNGTLNPLPLSLTGTINAVAINQGQTGLIGGTGSAFDGPGYAAFVLPDGTISPAAGFSGVTAVATQINSTAINDLNVGLVGGEGQAQGGGGLRPYGAYVALDGTVTEIPIPLASMNTGALNSVAINAQGVGIIGGFTQDPNAIPPTGFAYAAFVTPAAGAPLALSPLPSGLAGAAITSVAINNAGIGLIGGGDSAGNAYAGYATAQGVVTPLFGSPFAGFINGVAMNTSGTGLIGGQNGVNLYAAIVQPNGSVTSIITDSIAGSINSVAINDPGIGLIVGFATDGYAALVAPNGTLTLLDTSNVLSLSSTSLAGTLLNEATPQSIGPYLGVAYTQLAANYALEPRFLGLNNTEPQTRESDIALLEQNEDELLGWNKDELLASVMWFNANPTCKKKPADECSNKPNSIWAAPFGNYVFIKEQGKIPSYKNQIAGALLGYDHQGSNYLVGTCLGYAFNYISYGKGIGHGKIQEEMASFYGSYLREHFRLNATLWGGYYQFWNTRHTLSSITSSITSKGKTHGWVLYPRLEMATPWAIDDKKNYLVEPFISFDWINNWQRHFTETGKAGFNLKMGNVYDSLLQSEVGLRFYERFAYGWGDLCLIEKASYVNQAPFHVRSATTSFVGAASSFPIAIASNKVQNLGALELFCAFVPKNNACPYGGIALQAIANGEYQSYFASLFLGIDF